MALPLPPGGDLLDASDNGVTNPALLNTLVKVRPWPATNTSRAPAPPCHPLKNSSPRRPALLCAPLRRAAPAPPPPTAPLSTGGG